LDAILLSVSGGGMASGVALATHYRNQALNVQCKVILVEPKGKDMQQSLKTGRRLWPDPPRFVDTIADGIRMQQLGKLTFPILCELASSGEQVKDERQAFIILDVITVTDDEMAAACKLAAERAKLVIEPAAGAALAAAFKLKDDPAHASCRRLGVVLCGGNVDLSPPPWMLAEEVFKQ